MKTLLLSFTIALIAISCITQKRRDKICATCTTHTTIKDSIITEIKEREVPVFISDTFYYFLPNPCAKLCDSIGNLKPTFKAEIKSDKGTKIDLFVKDNQLMFKDVIDSLKRIITVKDSTIKTYHSKVIEVPAQCKKKHITWWDKLFRGLGQILSLIVLLFFGYKAVIYYIKFHKP
jgi:hypothetical protein